MTVLPVGVTREFDQPMDESMYRSSGFHIMSFTRFARPKRAKSWMSEHFAYVTSRVTFKEIIPKIVLIVREVLPVDFVRMYYNYYGKVFDFCCCLHFCRACRITSTTFRRMWTVTRINEYMLMEYGIWETLNCLGHSAHSEDPNYQPSKGESSDED